MNTAGPYKLRTIVESPLYTKTLRTLGDVPRLDDALAILTWAIACGADDFRIVPGTTRLRAAKTERINWLHGSVPPFRVWFSIRDEDTVDILFIEQVPLEEESPSVDPQEPGI